MSLFTSPVICSLGITALLAILIGFALIAFALMDVFRDRHGFLRTTGFGLFFAGIYLAIIFVTYSVVTYLTAVSA